MAHTNEDLEDSPATPIKVGQGVPAFFILRDFSILFQLTMNSFGFPNESTANFLVI